MSYEVYNLSNYTSPVIKEVSGKDYIKFGDDNDYFDYLIDNYTGSPTNNAIINGITVQLYGAGLDAKDKARKPQQWAALIGMLSPKDLRAVILDYQICGQASFQVIYEGDRVKYLKHFPVTTLRPQKANEDGEIENYYYCADWSKLKPSQKPSALPAFGFGSKKESEILYIKPYSTGSFYFAPTDYQGALPYCEVEQELANFHINNIKNGFMGSMLINFNNGKPDDDDQRKIEQKIKQKFTGSSNAGRFVLAFNDSKENAATIETVSLADAHNQYQFIAEEAQSKIMVEHRITSPMLLGIKDNTGLGNNAEELKTASLLFEATVLNPKRGVILDALEEVLAINDITLNLFFSSLNPFEEKREIEDDQTETNLSDARPFLDDDRANSIVNSLEGLGELESDLLGEYEMIEAEDVGDEPSDFDCEKYLNGLKLNAQDASEQDTERYKVRYTYQVGTRKKMQKGSTSRPLCKALMSSGRVYRKEDIEQMSSAGGAEAQGQQYDVFLWKGGVNCFHRWERRIYRKKLTKDGNIWGGGELNGTSVVSVSQAIRQGFRPEKNSKEVAKAPIDMDDKGRKV